MRWLAVYQRLKRGGRSFVFPLSYSPQNTQAPAAFLLINCFFFPQPLSLLLSNCKVSLKWVILWEAHHSPRGNAIVSCHRLPRSLSTVKCVCVVHCHSQITGLLVDSSVLQPQSLSHNLEREGWGVTTVEHLLRTQIKISLMQCNE